jgi:hypothetical protein
MRCESEQVEGKKPYEAPRLATISLRPEEAVLGHCKTTTAGGGPGGTCFLVGGCPSQGS